MHVRISDHMTYANLLRFALPCIIMMVFQSIYEVVDGFFVSNFAGSTALAAINLAAPLVMIMLAFGYMFGTGGTALISMKLGEGKREDADRYFSEISLTILIAGFILAAVGFIAFAPLFEFLGAEGALLDACMTYTMIILPCLPLFLLMGAFQSFTTAANLQRLGLASIVFAGILNIILDAVFIIFFDWGLAGAAAATAISNSAGVIICAAYFLSPSNSGLIRYTRKIRFEPRIILNVCTNGSSEMASVVSAALVSIVYNYQLLRFFGENGVDAYGVVMYFAFIFTAVFYGFNLAAGPAVSYQYGAENRKEMRNLFEKSIVIILAFAVSMFLLAEFAAYPLASVFVGYDQELLDLSVYAFRIYAAAFLLCGFTIFGSTLFTALNNGKISAFIAFMRALVFECGCVILLPILLGPESIWYAIIAAELASVAMTAGFIISRRKVYHYY